MHACTHACMHQRRQCMHASRKAMHAKRGCMHACSINTCMHEIRPCMHACMSALHACMHACRAVFVGWMHAWCIYVCLNEENKVNYYLLFAGGVLKVRLGLLLFLFCCALFASAFCFTTKSEGLLTAAPKKLSSLVCVHKPFALRKR